MVHCGQQWQSVAEGRRQVADGRKRSRGCAGPQSKPRHPISQRLPIFGVVGGSVRRLGIALADANTDGALLVSVAV